MDFIAMVGSLKQDQLRQQGPSLLEQYEANLVLVFSFEGEIQPSKSSMWKALATINLFMNAFKEKDGKLIQLSSLDIKPKRIPARTYENTKIYCEK